MLQHQCRRPLYTPVLLPPLMSIVIKRQHIYQYQICSNKKWKQKNDKGVGYDDKLKKHGSMHHMRKLPVLACQNKLPDKYIIAYWRHAVHSPEDY